MKYTSVFESCLEVYPIQTKDIAMLQSILNYITQEITMRYIGIDKEEQDNVLNTFSL